MTTVLKSARERLRREGVTVADWAKRNRFPLHAVRAVLYGRNKGNYGQAHGIAVALGVKDTER
ncbi:hypothetical protein [uncultured Amaricoccus sp.]|uniref:hypothetical protein n=1 Tax=uncultured Amaricoccus sp. TaxID=339341 RepID=UPI00345DCF7E